MEKRESVLNKVLKLKENINIRAIFQCGDRLNKAGVYDDTLAYEYILVLDNFKDFDEKILDIFSDIILKNKRNDPNPSYIFVLADYKKIIFNLREEFDYNKEYESNSLLNVIYDRDLIYEDIKIPTDISQRLSKPSEDEFYKLTIDFFTTIYDLGQSMRNIQLLTSQVIFEESRKYLLKMLEYYIACQYDFKINLGSKGKNIGAYLDSRVYHKLISSVSSDVYEKMWTSIFDSCSLFRKFGLAFSKKTGYEYPKKIDVEILKFLRKVWNERN